MKKYLQSFVMLLAVLMVPSTSGAARLLPNHTQTLTANCVPATTDLVVTTSDSAVAILGDANCDGFVDIEDVTALIDHVLGTESSPFNYANADVNSDGFLDVEDVTLQISYILNGFWPWDNSQYDLIFVPGDPAGIQTTLSASDVMSMGGITVSSTYAAFAAQQYRFGKNSVTTFRSDVGNIVKIRFICTDTNPAKGFGTNDGMTYDDPNGTWEGTPSTEVVITTKDKQVRATQIIFTIEASGLAAPLIKPAAGTYYNPVEVTITCATPGAKIYYTTNGNDPTTSSTLYSEPFTLNESATVKAISSKDGETSGVVSAEFEISGGGVIYLGLGDLGQIADGTNVILGYNATVLKQSGYRLYLMDETGFGLAYGNTGKTYDYGDVIPAGYGGVNTTWDGEPELQTLKGFKDPIDNIGGLPALEAMADEAPITCSEVGHPIWGQFVLLKQVTIDAYAGTYTDASGTCFFYDRFGVPAPGDLSHPYDVYGIVASYGKAPNTVYQVLPIEYESQLTPAYPTQ